MENKYTNFLIEDNEKIRDVIDSISPSMTTHIENHSSSKFIMLYKCINHSDIPGFGKTNNPDDVKSNLLYYLSSQKMEDLKNKNSWIVRTAKQSVIGLSTSFYTKTGLGNPRCVKQYKSSDYINNTFLVNDTLSFFNSTYTKKVFEKLDKKVEWDFNNLDLDISKSKFTPITITFASQGIGTKKDVAFHKLRHNIFNGDTFIIIYEDSQNEKNLYILLEKNPLFFSILGESNKTYLNYQKQMIKNRENAAQQESNAVDLKNKKAEITRKQQAKWRSMLATEMMNYSPHVDEVFCPFTYITANFYELGPLFVASHIKGFKDPNTTEEEKYDINNGLLLCRNADALFDKHLISINTNTKTLEFSYLLNKDMLLKYRLGLMQPIFTEIINEKRKRYLDYHYKIFQELESKRKKNEIIGFDYE